jgi:outer membrane biogenesis lipoprotein LolB
MILLLSGCAGQMNQMVTTVPDSQFQRLLEQVTEDQRRRQSDLQDWQFAGTLDLETRKTSRRHRIVMNGTGNRAARLLVYGPFRQIARDIRMDVDAIHMRVPDGAAPVQVPADRHGLHQLTGIALDPHHLLNIVLGFIALPVPVHQPVVIPDPDRKDNRLLRFSSAAHEQATVRLDSARLLGRDGTYDTEPWQVRYQWPDTQPYPQQIRVTWGDGEQLTILIEQWEFAAHGHLYSHR